MLSPLGRLHISVPEPSDVATAALPEAVVRRLESAFARSAAHGLLELGASEVAAALPLTLGYFRDFAALFFHRLRHIADLEAARATFEIAFPSDELPRLLLSAPPMLGAEYLDQAVLRQLWSDLQGALRDELASWDGTIERYLHSKHPSWNLLGRVCLHLAENKRDPEKPFAFLATYTKRLSQKAEPQHVPLGEAVRESSAAHDKGALLKLLLPVDRAAQRSGLIKELVDSGELFHPIAWTPRQAHRFLQEIPVLEEAGLLVRVPNWWKTRPRPQVTITVGGREPSQLGVQAILDFRLELSLGGETLSHKEWQDIVSRTDGLALVRGQWIEIDREKLTAALKHWKSIERSAAHDGLSFLDGMRLLAGMPSVANAVPDETRAWSQVVAGEWLDKALEGLRDPKAHDNAQPKQLNATLRPYQLVGTNWLHFSHSLRLGVCLADDMGLGKTIQVLALLLMHKQQQLGGIDLLVVPASLIANWQSEIDRFAPSLRAVVAHPSVLPVKEIAAMHDDQLANTDVVITTYGTLPRVPWFAERQWRTVILDEAQAIKNGGAKQTQAVKQLEAQHRIALTGTPVENRLGDLWSLFDFLNPGLLGTAKTFSQFAKQLEKRSSQQYAPLRNLIQPYILRRLKTDKRIISDLPDKTELKAFCSLSKAQATLYQTAVDELEAALDNVDGIKRRGLILASLMRLKQICNHPSQWLGSGDYAPDESGKFSRLRELCEAIAAKQEKVLVFSQFREITEPLAAFLEKTFGRPGVVLHGQTAVKDRQALVEKFQGDESVPFFVLSVKAGGTGLTLTAASHVIHFDRWWNPAVENQATDRAYRIGQRKNVLVHKFICRGTVEEKIDAMIESKQSLSRDLLEGGEMLLTEMDNAALLKLVSLDVKRAMNELE